MILVMFLLLCGGSPEFSPLKVTPFFWFLQPLASLELKIPQVMEISSKHRETWVSPPQKDAKVITILVWASILPRASRQVECTYCLQNCIRPSNSPKQHYSLFRVSSGAATCTWLQLRLGGAYLGRVAWLRATDFRTPISLPLISCV